MPNSASVLEQLLGELQSMQRVAGGVPVTGARHTTPTGVPSLPYMHGPNGLWSMTGVERDVISTRIQPVGLAGSIPARGSVTLNPLFPYLTGFLPGTGTNPNGVCDDWPTSGPMKNCLQTAQFGRYGRMTREIDITFPGRQINRGEFMDLRIVNDPLVAPGINSNGMITPGGAAQLTQELLMRFVEVGIDFQNLLSKQLYTGNPANNTAGGGYSEFPGLDLLIGTNKKDAITGQMCPSLNSLITDFNFRLVNDTSAGADIVRTITYMMRVLRSNSQRMNLDPTTWAVVMREALFYELTAVWPCSYMTYGCTLRATPDQQLVLDGGDMIAMRDAMRNGRYLLLDGAQTPVIFDDSVAELTSTTSNRVGAGRFASDIYFIPMSVKGGMSGLYWEYIDYSQTAIQTAQQGNIGQYFWTDGGRYLWHAKPPKNFCAQWLTIIEPRIIFPFPHLAAKLRNVMYQPLMHTRDPFPTDPYFVNGGVTSRNTAPSFFADYKG